VLDVFNATAVRRPDHAAIDAGDACTTYGQLASAPTVRSAGARS
jgi:hypothetical protein